jgi:hypothetical protein
MSKKVNPSHRCHKLESEMHNPVGMPRGAWGIQLQAMYVSSGPQDGIIETAEG